jgi:hypothetical protein
MAKRLVFERKNRGPIPALDRYAKETLERCAAMWDAAEGLDTAVRDNVAQGLAYLVWSAYDSVSVSKALGYACDDYGASVSFVAGATAKWFRDRGFAEWFCIAAGELFHNQRPRLKSELKFKVIRAAGNRKKKAS